MNEFLNALSKSLKHISEEEKTEILQDYREHFEIGLSAGKTEHDVVASLGNPVQLAKMYAAMGATRTANKSKGLRDAVRMIGAIARYKVGGGLLMGALYFVCLGALLILFGAAVGLIIGGAACIVYTVIMLVKGMAAYGIIALFTSLILGCGGLLGFKGNAKLCRITVGKLPEIAHRIMQEDTEKEFKE